MGEFYRGLLMRHRKEAKEKDENEEMKMGYEAKKMKFMEEKHKKELRVLDLQADLLELQVKQERIRYNLLSSQQ